MPSQLLVFCERPVTGTWRNRRQSDAAAGLSGSEIVNQLSALRRRGTRVSTSRSQSRCPKTSVSSAYLSEGAKTTSRSGGGFPQSCEPPPQQERDHEYPP